MMAAPMWLDVSFSHIWERSEWVTSFVFDIPRRRFTDRINKLPIVLGEVYLFIEPFLWVNRIQAILVETNLALNNFIEDSSIQKRAT
jgi:hypothetical protein